MNENWFTVEKIDESTFAISEYGHWEQMHSYLLIGEERACLIDTGLGFGNIKEVVDSLTDLPIVVVTTHVHADHIGGHGYYQEIAVHEADANWLRKGLPIPVEMVRKTMMQEPLRKPAPEGFDINQYVPFTGEPTMVLKDGDELKLGGRSLQILHTPGHAPGHICIYEADRGYLYTGDLVYQGTLFAHYPSTDPVAFAASVEKLVKLPRITRILPAHNELELPDDFLSSVHQAFIGLKAKNLLFHGSGLHEFIGFAIKL